MESTRTCSLSLILSAAVILTLGFCAGFFSAQVFVSRRNLLPRHSIGSDIIRTKRMQAIQRARQQGKSDYQFEVTDFHPVLNK